MANNKYNNDDLINELYERRFRKGHSVKSLLQFLMEELEYSKSAAYEWVSKLNDAIDEQNKEIRTNAMNDSINRWEDYAQKCLEEDDLKNYAVALKALDQLKGLDKQKLELSGEVNIPVINIILNKDTND
jgi:hypothetical protein